MIQNSLLENLDVSHQKTQTKRENKDVYKSFALENHHENNNEDDDFA